MGWPVGGDAGGWVDCAAVANAWCLCLMWVAFVMGEGVVGGVGRSASAGGVDAVVVPRRGGAA